MAALAHGDKMAALDATVESETERERCFWRWPLSCTIAKDVWFSFGGFATCCAPHRFSSFYVSRETTVCHAMVLDPIVNLCF